MLKSSDVGGKYSSASTHVKHFRVNAVSETTRKCFYTKFHPQRGRVESNEWKSEWRQKKYTKQPEIWRKIGEEWNASKWFALASCVESSISSIFNNVSSLIVQRKRRFDPWELFSKLREKLKLWLDETLENKVETKFW